MRCGQVWTVLIGVGFVHGSSAAAEVAGRGSCAQASTRATSRSARSAPGSSVSGIMARADQVDRVPALTQGLQVVGDGEVGPIVAAGVLGPRE